MLNRRILLGNEAIAHGLVESGCTLAASYPGTPSSEVLGALVRIKEKERLKIHLEWSVNEKIAFEVALANSYTGRRSAVIMKQVGLNVAADPLMSAAYTGVKGGFVLVVADDPGPHSSQTEQDSRCYAMMAKIPVFDPSSPQEARECVRRAFELSERYEIPVMLRPTTRICHARQDMEIRAFADDQPPPAFEKNPARWAATPKFRLQLHRELNDKVKRISEEKDFHPREWGGLRESSQNRGACIVASGVVSAYVAEILTERKLLATLPFYRPLVPYPLPQEFCRDLLERYERILVLEETDPVMEMQLRKRDQVYGRLTGTVPDAGELLPETVDDILSRFLDLPGSPRPEPARAPGRRPTLCAGCSHRASFFAIKKVFRKGIYAGDIGCYTLGLNLGAVDTVLCMGASISQAAGFYQAHRAAGVEPPPVAATIGDSTFFHAGLPALVNAVVQGARFVLVVLDNSTTAMTGHQPTPAAGRTLDGRPVPAVSITGLVKACGVSHVTECDPYDFEPFVESLKDARRHTEDPDGGIAVVVAKHPCLMDRHQTEEGVRYTITVNEKCEGCGYCIKHFECPALVSHGEGAPIAIHAGLCSGCGVCVHACPHGALERQRKLGS